MLVRDTNTGKRYKVDTNFSDAEQYLLLEGISNTVRGVKSIVSVDTFKTRFEKISAKPIIKHIKGQSRTGDFFPVVYYGCLITYDGELYQFSKCHPKDQYSKKKAIEIAKLKSPLSYNSLFKKINNFNEGRYYPGKETILQYLQEMKLMSKKVFLK